MPLKITNEYGNVDVREGVPKGYVYVKGQRLQPLCRKLKIQFAPAVVGFQGDGEFGYRPQFDGVVVSARSASKLLAEIEARERRAHARPAQKIADQQLAEVIVQAMELSRRGGSATIARDVLDVAKTLLKYLDPKSDLCARLAMGVDQAEESLLQVT